jgi:oligo-1,6-glucosidase
MQWNDSDQAGFTTGVPWIKVNPNYKAINVDEALADPDSVFYYYKKLI